MILSENAGASLLVTRFAPSPTGLLHLGHACSALHAWQRARQAGGRFLLRLEDIDPQRCRAEFAEAILEDLRWLGLEWDGPVRTQSQHMAEYGRTLDRLRRCGLLYPCFCSRSAILHELAQSNAAPHPGAERRAALYPGTCRVLDPARRAERIAAGVPHAWRLDMQAALARVASPLCFEDADAPASAGPQPCNPEQFGDAVLAGRHTPVSYHLCVTHDDWLQGVSLVVRGEDLRAATGLHRLLQALLGWTPPAYSHHHLLCDAAGRRLSKRDGARSIRAMRESGVSASDVRAAAGFG